MKVGLKAEHSATWIVRLCTTQDWDKCEAFKPRYRVLIGWFMNWSITDELFSTLKNLTLDRTLMNTFGERAKFT